MHFDFARALDRINRSILAGKTLKFTMKSRRCQDHLKKMKLYYVLKVFSLFIEKIIFPLQCPSFEHPIKINWNG